MLSNRTDEGSYMCVQCGSVLYQSSAKFAASCVWPSFRVPAGDDAVLLHKVTSYNNYACGVEEVYCAACKLFIGWVCNVCDVCLFVGMCTWGYLCYIYIFTHVCVRASLHVCLYFILYQRN